MKKTGKRSVTTSIVILMLLTPLLNVFGQGQSLAEGLTDFLNQQFLGLPLWSILLAFVIIVYILFKLEYLDKDEGAGKILAPLASLSGVFLIISALILFGPQVWAMLSPRPPAPATTGYVLTKPLRITIKDELKGTTISNGTLSIYPEGSTTVLETIGFDAAYEDTSAYPEYKSGNRFNVYYVGSGTYHQYTKYWTTIVAPLGSTDVDAFLPVVVKVVVFPTSHASYVQTPDGSVYSTDRTGGNTLNTTDIGAKPTLLWQYRIVSDNTGFKSYTSPITTSFPRREAVFCIVVTVNTGNRPALTGLPKIYTDSSKDIYAVAVSELMRKVDSDGNVDPVHNGILNYEITIDTAPMTANAIASLEVSMVYHTNIDYLAAYGSHPTGSYTYDVVDVDLRCGGT